MSARLIAFEGSDGAGKATQTDLLEMYLNQLGKKVGRVSFPRYNLTLGGTLLYEVMKSDRAYSYGFSKVDPYVVSLLYAMDRRESKAYLESLIATHDVVIFDRYVESNLLHQGGKFLFEDERLNFANWLFDLEYGLLGLPNPQDIVYLSIPFSLSQKRAKLREELGGDKMDVVEKDLRYVMCGHEAGLFYAKHFNWHVVEGVNNEEELSTKEVHKKVLKALGYI